MAKKTRKQKQEEQQVTTQQTVEQKAIPQSFDKNVKTVFWSILGITFAVFVPSLFNEFVLWDDPEYVYNNPFFKDFSFATVFSTETFYMGNYHPLTILWLYWESLLFGSGGSEIYNGFQPFGFHLNNLLLHVLNTALVFYIIIEFLGKEKWQVAAISSILFGIHPMHVESVAWISEIKDVLYGAFFLGALYTYAKYLNSKDIKLVVIAFVFFVLSNLAKAQAVTLPVVFVMMDLYKNRKIEMKMLLEKVPFFAVSVFYGLLALEAQKSEGAINPNFISMETPLYVSYGILIYIIKLFAPIGLSGAHPYPTNPVFEELPGYFTFLPLGVLALIGAGWYYGRKNKIIWFGGLFYLVTIFLMLKLVPVGDTIIAERYTYIPYIGLFMILGWIVDDLSKKENLKQPVQYASLGVVALLSVMTWQRTTVWENTFTFWSDVSEKYPNYWRGYNCIGQEYQKMAIIAQQQGNKELAKQHYQSAITNLTASCENDKWAPPVPYMLRGAIYIDNLNDVDNAIKDFQKVISFPNPNDPTQLQGRHNLAYAYNKKGQYAEAVKVLNQAIQMNPQHPQGYLLMGKALTGLKDYKQAIKVYSDFLNFNPNNTTALLYRGIVYNDNLNQPDQAIADFQKIVQLKGNRADSEYTNAFINIGVCLYKKGQSQAAIEQYNKCLQIMPNNGRVYYLRALAFAQGNNFAQAYQDAQQAAQLGMQLNQQQVNDWKTKAGL